MPLYEYSCKQCRKKFEVLRKHSDTSAAACPKCGSQDTERKPSGFNTPGNAPTPPRWRDS